MTETDIELREKIRTRDWLVTLRFMMEENISKAKQMVTIKLNDLTKNMTGLY